MSSYIGKFLVVVNNHTNLESKKFVQEMAKHLASMQCWIPYQSWLSRIEGQASCPDLSEASEQEPSQAGKERLTCIVGYNIAFVCQWFWGGGVHTLTCWVKCGRDTWILVSASGGNTPIYAARAGIIRAAGITAVEPSCLLFLLRCFLRHGFVPVIAITHFNQSTKTGQSLVKESDMVC